MKKTVMILAHPKIENSTANKLISSIVDEQGNIEIRDIAKLYPDYKIDIETEQKALLEADRIIFQFPIYWYNMPAILKQWIDEVLTYGFAYGTAHKLENKELMVSVTTGGNADAYSDNLLEEKILFSFKGIANYSKMKYLKPLALHGALPGTDKQMEEIANSAKKIAQELTEIINN